MLNLACVSPTSPTTSTPAPSGPRRLSIAIILPASAMAAHFGFLGVAWWENRIYAYTFLWSDRALQAQKGCRLHWSVPSEINWTIQ